MSVHLIDKRTPTELTPLLRKPLSHPPLTESSVNHLNRVTAHTLTQLWSAHLTRGRLTACRNRLMLYLPLVDLELLNNS